MTVIEHQQLFEQALQHRDTDLLLVAFVRLIVALEHALQETVEHLLEHEATGDAELYRATLHHLQSLDILAYVSGGSDVERNELRQLLNDSATTPVVVWYHDHWSWPPHATTSIILGALARALRTALTVMYGCIELLQAYTSINERQEAAYQHMIMNVDIVRVCRNQLRVSLAKKQIDIGEM